MGRCLRLALGLSALALLRHAGAATTSQPSLPPETAGFKCGAQDTQVSICFPGNRWFAQCEYAVSNKTSTYVVAQPCPSAPLFSEECTTLEGLLVIAFGPCQSPINLRNSSVSFANAPAPSPESQDAEPGYKPIVDWLKLLGLQGITQIGGFLVRGYAYQLGPLPSTYGVDILPNLEKVGGLVPVTTDNARLSPLTILGAAVPQLDFVTDLEGGMLLENTPNVNFSNVFGSLHTIKGIIRIVGNRELTSLDGLQGLSIPDALNNLEILSNPRLTDIDALENVFECERDGRTGVVPSNSTVGVIEVKPATLKAPKARCLLVTAHQVCSFIANQTCPSGTDGTASGVPVEPNTETG